VADANKLINIVNHEEEVISTRKKSDFVAYQEFQAMIGKSSKK
jgi:hypothetical protein